MSAKPPANLSRSLKFLVVGVLYFAEGVPFGFVYTTLAYYLRSRGVPLEQIGILSLLGLAWSLKVLWSPLADRFGSRAAWLVPAQALVVASMLGLAFVAAAPVSLAFWVLVGVLCLASATQDLAVDAYTIDLLDTDELGMANGIRIGAYRVGLIAAGGGVLILSDLVGWSPTFVGVAILMAALALTVIAFGPFHQGRPEVARAQAGKGFGQVKESVQGLMRHPHMGIIIIFILAYKAGDAFLGAMVSPFWRDLGYSGTQFGVASITVGKVPAIVGGFLGGMLTARWGISRALWVLGIFQACSILGYWAAALPGAWSGTIYLATLGESLAGQMGSAAFLAFLMCLCDKRYSASHYAFLSMLFGLSARVCGYIGGWAAAYFGYATFFFLSFLIAWPAFALLPWVLPVVRQIEEQGAEVREEGSGVRG
ncbi:MAG: MFS transporter [Syntrophobacterales bacterium]|jgi:PAT family beta-lactamase induction signal transducer AmpG|nr:MFS transporter [Syntrophobacterales bacterium]